MLYREKTHRVLIHRANTKLKIATWSTHIGNCSSALPCIQGTGALTHHAFTLVVSALVLAAMQHAFVTGLLVAGLALQLRSAQGHGVVCECQQSRSSQRQETGTNA
jgi:hypothetical protein